MFKKKLLRFVFIATAFLAGCGGGGGGSDTSTPVTTKTTFTTADFSAKSVYLVDRNNGVAEYAVSDFAANGTGMTSVSVGSGIPVASIPFTWVVTNGQLIITPTTNGLAIPIVITLAKDDPSRRYYRISASSKGITTDGGIFYDQDTGLTQAQQFVTQNQAL